MKDDISLEFMSILVRCQPSEWRPKSIVIVCATAQSISQRRRVKKDPWRASESIKKILFKKEMNMTKWEII